MVNAAVIALIPLYLQSILYNIVITKESDTKFAIEFITQAPTQTPTNQPTIPAVNITNLRALNYIPEEN